MPELRAVPSAIRPLRPEHETGTKRFRALDVGAGIGRVTADVLLHLVSDVVLLEPVRAFIDEARRRCQGTSTSDESSTSGWTGILDERKSVSFFQAPLQDFDPARPGRGTEGLARLGYTPAEDDVDSGFDVVWCQWCLGHLNDQDLVAFLKRSTAALRSSSSLIVVKENLCGEKKGSRTVFDETDSSWTRHERCIFEGVTAHMHHRSDLAFKKIFKDAELHLVRQKTQRGFPVGLYPVKMYVADHLVLWQCHSYIELSYRYALRPNA